MSDITVYMAAPKQHVRAMLRTGGYAPETIYVDAPAFRGLDAHIDALRPSGMIPRTGAIRIFPHLGATIAHFDRAECAVLELRLPPDTAVRDAFGIIKLVEELKGGQTEAFLAERIGMVARDYWNRQITLLAFTGDYRPYYDLTDGLITYISELNRNGGNEQPFKMLLPEILLGEPIAPDKVKATVLT